MLYITQHVPSHIYDLLLLPGPEIYVGSCWGANLQKEPGIKYKIYGQHTEKKKERKSCSWLLGWLLLLYMHDSRALLHVTYQKASSHSR